LVRKRVSARAGIVGGAGRVARDEAAVVEELEPAEQQDLVDRAAQVAQTVVAELVRRVEGLLDEPQDRAAVAVASLGELEGLAQHAPLRALGAQWQLKLVEFAAQFASGRSVEQLRESGDLAGGQRWRGRGHGDSMADGAAWPGFADGRRTRPTPVGEARSRDRVVGGGWRRRQPS
jgi:hypothetical protein